MTSVRHNLRRFFMAGGPVVALRLLVLPGLVAWTAWREPGLLPYALALWALALAGQALRLRRASDAAAPRSVAPVAAAGARGRWRLPAAESHPAAGFPPAGWLLELGLSMTLPMIAGTWQTPWLLDAWIALAIACWHTRGIYRLSALTGWWIYSLAWHGLLAEALPPALVAAMFGLPLLFLVLVRPSAPAAAPTPDAQLAGHLQTVLRRFEQIKVSLGDRSGPDASALLDASLQASRGIQELRSLLEIVAPPASNVPTLADRLQSVTAHWQEANAIPVAFSAYPAPRSLPSMLETLLLRALEETLSNVERHAKASQVEVELRAEDDNLQLIVRDNGVGLVHGSIQRPGCNGLRMLRYRVQEFNGQLEVYEGVDGGLVVQLAVPLSVYAL